MTAVISNDRQRTRRRSRSSSHSAAETFEPLLGYGVELCIALVLILSPLAFGSVEYWAQWWMTVGIGGALVCLLARWMFYPRTCRPTISYAYLPIALFLVLVVVQWVGLPASLVSMISPKAAVAWTQVSQFEPGEAIRHSVSLYPLATERQLRILLMVTAVFVIVLNHIRGREEILRLLSAIVISGSIVAGIAISQNLSHEKSTLFGVQTMHPDSGPFMNHSAFGQFMNLATGAALALLFIGLKRKVGGQVSYRSLRHHLVRKSSLALLLPLLFILIAPVLVALSMTRGGVLSIVIAGGVTSVLMSMSQFGKGKRSLIVIFACVLLMVMLKFGFDRVYDRMSTLRDLHETGGGVRLQMVRDMIPMFRDFPILGIGLGVFSHVFPGYDSAAIATFATHAENDYAQLAVETGIVGVLLFLTFVAVVAFHSASSIRLGRRSIHVGAIGLVFGLIAILVHSASDFGQHVPAVACVTATICALLIRLGIDARSDLSASQTVQTAPQPPVSSARRYSALGLVALMIAAMCLINWRTGKESDAEELWMQSQKNFAELERRGLAETTDLEFISTLKDMNSAVAIMPNDAEHRFGLNAMRMQSIDRYDRALTSGFLEKISAECLKVAMVAPYYGPAITLAGQIRAFDLNDPTGIPLVRRGYALARYSKEASLGVALIDARESKWDSCMENLRRAIKLGVRPVDAANLLFKRFSRTDLALQIVEGSRADMIQFAEVLDQSGDSDRAAVLLEKAVKLLVAEANDPDAPLDAVVQLADAYVRDGQNEQAIPLLRRALAARYDQSEWRISLIHALVATGQSAEALSEARINNRLNPGDARSKQILEDLVIAPSTQRSLP